MDNITYKRIYPNKAISPRFISLPKVHKRIPPQAYSLKEGFKYLWSCKRIS